jgi:hypothetical protein
MDNLLSISQPAPPVTVSPPEYKLFKYTAVALATALGSVLAGAIVMAINYKRLGRPSAMWAWLIGGMVALTAIMALPDLPGASLVVYSSMQIVGMYHLAKAMLKKHLDKHLLAGGRLVSLWWSAGVGLIALVLVVPIGLTVETLTERSVQISQCERIVCSGTATVKDAMALGKALQQQGYFDGSVEAEAEISKIWWSMPTITFVVAGEVDEEMTEQFRQLGKDIAGSVGGLPVKLKLVNEYYLPKRTLTVR